MIKETDPCWAVDDRDPDFSPTYVNASHEWLFHYGPKMSPSKLQREMPLSHELYTEHPVVKACSSKLPKRKKLALIFYRNAITNEVLESLDHEDPVPPQYDSEYHARYQHPDDLPLPGECYTKNELKPKEPTGAAAKDDPLEKLTEKYPLYSMQPMTYWFEKRGICTPEPFRRIIPKFVP